MFVSGKQERTLPRAQSPLTALPRLLLSGALGRFVVDGVVRTYTAAPVVLYIGLPVSS